MTHLRQKMLDELQRRNYSENTVYTYLHAVEDFSKYFHRSPDRLGPDHIRQYQAYLFRERKLQASLQKTPCAGSSKYARSAVAKIQDKDGNSLHLAQVLESDLAWL